MVHVSDLLQDLRDDGYSDRCLLVQRSPRFVQVDTVFVLFLSIKLAVLN